MLVLKYTNFRSPPPSATIFSEPPLQVSKNFRSPPSISSSPPLVILNELSLTQQESLLVLCYQTGIFFRVVIIIGCGFRGIYHMIWRINFKSLCRSRKLPRYSYSVISFKSRIEQFFSFQIFPTNYKNVLTLMMIYAKFSSLFHLLVAWQFLDEKQRYHWIKLYFCYSCMFISVWLFMWNLLPFSPTVPK